MLRTRTALVGLALCALPLVALTACSSASSPSSSSAGSGSSSKPSGSGASSSSSSNVARPTDMCALLSTAEASSVTGDTYGDPSDQDGYCGFTGETSKFDLTLSPTEVNWKTAESIAKVQYGSDLKAVSGVGDQAMEAPNFLEVRKGSVIFDINDPDGDGDTGPQYIALAKIVLSHLG